MTSHALQRKIDEHNQNAIRRLVEQLKSPDGVIPFVGAGMSADFRFKQWAAFLLDQALVAHVESEVKDLLNRGLYEEAAELVMDRLERGAFQQAMEDEFGEYKLEHATIKGAVALLPRLPGRIVITTNFDRVLEWVFGALDPRDRLRVVHGANTLGVTKAFRQSTRVLIKIHGDVEDTKDRVLTRSEYERSYGAADPENFASTQLTEGMRVLLTRSLLFLGCSLERDRIVTMLARLFQDLRGGLYHFAIVAAPAKEDAFVKRYAALGKMGIRPIWYPDGQFAEIERLLLEIVAQLSPSQAANRPSPLAASVMSESELEDKYWDGTTALRMRRYQEALSLLEAVAAEKPDYKQVRTKIAEAETELERTRLDDEAAAAESVSAWDQAIAALERLLQISPGDEVRTRLDHARRQLQLDALWEEAGEMYRRQRWAAVVEAFDGMKKIDPDVRDLNGWLEHATRELQEEETRRQVKFHLREVLELYDSQEWGKALSVLNQVLELDPRQETALELRPDVQAKVASAEAAALLAERHRKATRAVGAKNWDEAVELLSAVIKEDPAYLDAPALFEQATQEAAEASAEFELTLFAKPSPAPPDSEVTWTLKVRNSGRVALSGVCVEERGSPPDGTQPSSQPFDLNAGKSKTLLFKSRHTTRGVRRHIEVSGSTPNGRSVRADVKASVNVVKPAKEDAPAVLPARTPVTSASVATPHASVVPAVSPPPTPSLPSSIVTRPALAAAAFRESLREAKDVTALSDSRSSELIHLLEDGERHYRIAVHALNRPRDWDAQVETWERQVAELKLDKVQFVSLSSPGPDAILKKMERLAVELQRHIGVVIPLDGLESLARNG